MILSEAGRIVTSANIGDNDLDEWVRGGRVRVKGRNVAYEKGRDCKRIKRVGK